MKKLSLLLVLMLVFTSLAPSVSYATSVPDYGTAVALKSTFAVSSSNGVALTNVEKAPYSGAAYRLYGKPSITLGITSGGNTIQIIGSSMKNSGEKTVIETDFFSTVEGQGLSIRIQHYTSAGGNSGISKSMAFISGDNISVNQWHRIALELTYNETENSTLYTCYVDGEYSHSETLADSYKPRLVRFLPYAPSKNEYYEGYFRNPIVYNCASTNDYASNYSYISGSLTCTNQSYTIDNTNNVISGIPHILKVSDVLSFFGGSDISSVNIYGADDITTPKSGDMTILKGDILAAESTDGIIKTYEIDTVEAFNTTVVPLEEVFSVAASRGIALSETDSAPYAGKGYKLYGMPTAALTENASSNSVILIASSMSNSGEKTVVEADVFSPVEGQGFSIRIQHYTSTGGNSGTSKSVSFVYGKNMSANQWHRIALELSYNETENTTVYTCYVDGKFSHSETLEASYKPRMVRILPYAPSNKEYYEGYFKNPYVYNCSSYYDYGLYYGYRGADISVKVSDVVIDNTDMTISNIPDDYSVNGVKALFDGENLKTIRIYDKNDVTNAKNGFDPVTNGDLLVTESTDGILSVYTVEASDIELTYDFYVIDSYTGEESLEISSPTDIAQYAQNVISPGKAAEDTSYRIYGETGGSDDKIQSSGRTNGFKLVNGKKDIITNYDKVVTEFDVYADAKDYGFTDFGVAVRGIFYNAAFDGNKGGQNTLVKIANINFSGNMWHKFVVEYDYSNYGKEGAISGRYNIYMDGELIGTANNSDDYFIPSTIWLSPYADLYFTEFDMYFDNIKTYCTNIGYIADEKNAYVKEVYSGVMKDGNIITDIPDNTSVSEFTEGSLIENAEHIAIFSDKKSVSEKTADEYITDGDVLSLVSEDGVVTLYTLSLKKDNGVEMIFDNDKPGYAGGKIAVRTEEDVLLSFYWGDDEGILDDYTYLIIEDIKAGYTNFVDIYKYIAIPEGATKLYAYNGDELLYTYDIPEEKIFDYKREVYSFGVMSDIHFGQRYYDSENKKNGIKDEPELTGILNNALDIYKERDAKFVTIAGDIVTKNSPWEWDNYRKWVDAFVKENPTVDFYTCSGNHDVLSAADSSHYPGLLDDVMGYESFSRVTGASQYYTGDIERHYNEVNENYGFYFEYQGDVFVFLNTIKYTGNKMLTKEHFDWLEGILNANTDNTVYLYFHWPQSGFSGSYILSEESYEKNGVSHTNTAANSVFDNGYALCTKMKSLLKDRQNVVYISGHKHNSAINQYLENSVTGEYNYQISINDMNDAFGPFVNIGSSARSTMPNSLIERYGDEVFAESSLMRVFDDRMVLEAFDAKTKKYQAFGIFVSDIASHKYDTTFIDSVYSEDVIDEVSFTIEDDVNATVFFAVYENGMMTFMDKADYKEGGVYSLQVGKKIPDGAEVKLFIWKTDSIEPLCRAAIIK